MASRRDPFYEVLEDSIARFSGFSSDSSSRSSPEPMESSQRYLMSEEAAHTEPSYQAIRNTPVYQLFTDSVSNSSHGNDNRLAVSDIRDILQDSKMSTQNGSHSGAQNTLMAQIPQKAQMPTMPTMPTMPALPPMLQTPLGQSLNFSAESLDHVHKSTLIELATFAFKMCSFHEQAGIFTKKMSELASDLNERVIKAETERDHLLQILSQHQQQQEPQHEHQQPQLNETVSVPRTPTENDSSNTLFYNDDDERMPFASPVTPSKLPFPNSNFSLLSKDSVEDDPFVSKPGSVKKSKSEKTRARKALQIKIPSGPIPMLTPKPVRSTKPSDILASPTPSRISQVSATTHPTSFMRTKLPEPSASQSPFTSTTPTSPSEHPTTFVPAPSSVGTLPPSPFVAAPASNAMGPLSPIKNAPASNVKTALSSSVMAPPPPPFIAAPMANYMAPPSPFADAPIPSPMGPPSPFVTTPSSSGFFPPSPFVNYGPTSFVDLSPLTPGRIGPGSGASQRSLNSVLKRRVHNLVAILPPSNAAIPELPLTDTEIIVYFFQSLARPIVSLRLYSRGWGPATICDVLNKHRTIEGGYLRNTASVKCTTAIKKGREKYGEAWHDEFKVKFANANDYLATDYMRMTAVEQAAAPDIDIVALDLELKEHPTEDVDGGIFTKCVKWCCAHRDHKYTLKNVHELALLLRCGEDPRTSVLAHHLQQHVPDMLMPGDQDFAAQVPDMVGQAQAEAQRVAAQEDGANDMMDVEYMGTKDISDKDNNMMHEKGSDMYHGHVENYTPF